MGRFRTFLICMTAFCCLRAQCRFSEFLIDPSDDNTGEFIEVYNAGDAALLLSRFFLADAQDTDRICPFPDSLLLPGHYGLLLDPNYAGEYEALIPDSVPRFTIDDARFGMYGLSNSTPKPFALLDEDRQVCDLYVTGSPAFPKAGYSIERYSPDDTLWQASIIMNGTPGYRNSTAQKPQQLEISSLAVTAGTDRITLDITVRNTGSASCGHFTIGYIMDISARDPAVNRTGELDCDSLVLAGDSCSIRFLLPVSCLGGGRILTYLSAEPDICDTLVVPCEIPVPEGGIMITEFVCKTGNRFSTEYIEFFSRALLPVQMRGLRIADMTGEISLNSDYVLMPDSFAVAAQSAAFHDDFPFVNNVIYPAAWRGLNNGEDIIRLSGPSGPHICDLRYDSTWDIPDDCAMLLVDTALDMKLAANWEYSFAGSPGRMNRTRRRMHHLRCLEESAFLPASDTLCLHFINDGYAALEDQLLFLSTAAGSHTFPLPPSFPGDTLRCFPDTSVLFVPGTHTCAFATADTSVCSGRFRYYSPYEPAAPPLLFNEVMADPSGTYGQAEFIELYGVLPLCDLENWTLGVNSARLTLSGSAGPGFTVICDADDPVLQAPLSRRLSFASFPALPNGGALLVLYDPRGRVMDRFDLRDHPELEPGRSLEKQAETLPSDDPALWLASVAEGGMSPGARNSVTPLPGQRYALSVFPEIFQPGTDAVLQITVDSETPLSCCELYCFNAGGQTVFRIERSLFSQPSALIFWDGKMENGSYPARGLYLLCAVLHDPEGGTLTLRKTFAIR